MNHILGVSLELQEKILKLIQTLVQKNRQLTGTIVMIKDVGPGFCWGVTDQESLKKAIEYFRVSDRQHEFSIVEVVLEMPAGKLMQKIHRLRDEAGLPGILKYLELQKEEAA